MYEGDFTDAKCIKFTEYYPMVYSIKSFLEVKEHDSIYVTLVNVIGPFISGLKNSSYDWM